MTGRNGVIFDGARGAGQALARVLSDTGWRLVLTDPDADAAGTAARSLGQTGRACDPCDGASVGRLAYDAADALGDIDLVALVLNGAGPARDAQSRDAEAFDRLLADRARPLYHAARHFAPPMIARGSGTILIVATLPAGPDPWQDAAAGWIAAATRALSAEWAGSGVRVNALLAARDDTPPLPRFMAARAPVAKPPVPLGALPQPAEIAAAALPLCAGGAMTGQVLRIDGGRG